MSTSDLFQKSVRDKKKKVYVITLSNNYMKGHPKAGQHTFFREKFIEGIGKSKEFELYKECFQRPYPPKIHTIRGNFPLWEKRIKEVLEHKAVLSIRKWTGKPYRSPQVEIAMLSAQDGVGIQKVVFYPLEIGLGEGWNLGIEGRDTCLVPQMVAHNDGLLPDDFKAWFKGYDLSEPMAIIHFTKFRY